MEGCVAELTYFREAQYIFLSQGKDRKKVFGCLDSVLHLLFEIQGKAQIQKKRTLYLVYLRHIFHPI